MWGEATQLHNAACEFAALGKPEEALAAIEQAAALGYAALEHLRTDTDVVPCAVKQRWMQP